MTSNISMQQMLEAGVHFGHQTRYWHPKMKPYIFGTRYKIHIINLDKTLPLMQDALNFISSLAAKKGKILFVGTKLAARDIMQSESTRCGMPCVSNRWLGGMLTNYKTLRQSIKRLKDLEELRDSPINDSLTKKESLLLSREICKLEKNLGGVRHMGGLPDAIFVVDIGHEKIAISEARKLKIPVIGVVDTNCDPAGIDYLIPGNDDAVKAIKFYVQHVADTIVTARQHIVAEIAAEEREDKKFVKRNAKPPMKKVVTAKAAGQENDVVLENASEEAKHEHDNAITENTGDELANAVAAKHKTVKVIKESVSVAKEQNVVKPVVTKKNTGGHSAAKSKKS